MKIRSTINSGVAEVSDELGARLVAAGGWVGVEAEPTPAAPVRKARTRKAPVEEPQSEE